jgi:hypothetical protein
VFFQGNHWVKTLTESITTSDVFSRAVTNVLSLGETVGLTDVLKKLRNGSSAFLKNVAKNFATLTNTVKHNATLSTIAKHVTALRNKDKS